MVSGTREEVEIMLRDHRQNLKLRITETVSRSQEGAIEIAVDAAVSRSEESKAFSSVKTEVDQVKVYLESVVTKEGQKDVLMEYQTMPEHEEAFGGRLIQLELSTTNWTTELVELQKSAEVTEQKIIDAKATMGRERDEVRIDWSARLTQLKDSQQEASTYISELRRRVPELDLSLVSADTKLSDTSRQVEELRREVKTVCHRDWVNGDQPQRM